MNKQLPVTFISSSDFLKLILSASQEWHDKPNFTDFCEYLHEHIFCKLGPVFAEIYFLETDGEAFLPHSCKSGILNHGLRYHVPSEIRLNDPSLAALMQQFTFATFSGGAGVPDFLLKTNNKSHALLPIAQNNRLSAVLYVGCPESLPFPDDYLQGLQTLAGTINAWMKSMTVIADLQNSMRSLEYSEQLRQALYEINEQAHVVSTTEKLYSALHKIVGRLINARNFFIALREERDGEQYIKFTYYYDERDSHFQGMEIKIDPTRKHSMTSFILQSGKSLLLGPESFDQFCQDNDIQYLGSKSYSLIGVPFYLDHLAGVVLVQSYSEVIYDKKDKDLLVYVARHIGDALEKKKTLDDMRDANEVFSLFMRYSPAHIYIKEVTESGSRILQASENFKEILSKPIPEIVGKTMAELFPADFAKKITAEDFHVVSTGVHLHVEEHFNGQTYTTIKYPIKKGGRTLLAGYTINISDRKAMEEALRESERRYRIIFEKSPLGVIRYDCEGNMLDFNDKFIEIMGSSREKLLGFNSARQSSPTVQEAIKKALAGEISSFEENYTSITGGKTSYIRGIFNPISPGQNPTDVIATIEDITEQKNYEKEQQKIEKLDSLGILAGGIAHDFNNILTGITANISFAQLLLDPNDSVHHPLAEAEKASIRAADLARQLLTFAKGGEPKKKEISLQSLIQDAVSLMLRGSNVKAMLDIKERVHTIEADEGQISQVLNNMLINATQAMPKGGRLNITLGNSCMAANNKLGLVAGPYAKIALQDEGCGIPPEIKEKIFDPYFTTKAQGTGLGLASAYSIIHRHKGHIAVNSVVNQGSVFTIYLPSLGKSHADHFLAPPEKTFPRHGGSILVMDDEELIRNLAELLLTHLGYTVTSCTDGEEAIELYRQSVGSQSPYKAVIMDLTIPGGLGGKQTAERILSRFPTACLIVSSGYSQDPIMADYQKYGFCGAIVKPYSIKDFDQVLGSLPDPH